MNKLPIFVLLIIISAYYICIVCSAESVSDGEIGFNAISDETGLTIYIKNYDGFSMYDFSTDGGKTFFGPIGNGGIHLSSFPAGTYQLCVRRSGDINSVTDITTFIVGKRNTGHGNISIKCTGIREKKYKSGGIRVTIDDYDPRRQYIITYDGGVSWYRVRGSTAEFNGLFSGYYEVCVRAADDIQTSSEFMKVYVPPGVPDGAGFIKAPMIYQMPELPTGCEVTSLAMSVGFWGINVEKTVLADYFLEKSEYRTDDFREVFVGDPRSEAAYGCYSEVIVKCAERFLSSIKTRSFDVTDISGSEPSRLYSYVDMGYPVIVWASSKMMPVTDGARWLNRDTGEIMTWKSNEHCMLLVGYDNSLKRVYVNDPQQGIVYYDQQLFEKRFREMENQAVLIVETTGQL